jgi:hypothetical protein
MPEQLTSTNFSFLAAHDAQLVRLGGLAESYFGDDPNTSLLKLRQFGETPSPLSEGRFEGNCFPGFLASCRVKRRRKWHNPRAD